MVASATRPRATRRSMTASSWRVVSSRTGASSLQGTTRQRLGGLFSGGSLMGSGAGLALEEVEERVGEGRGDLGGAEHEVEVEGDVGELRLVFRRERLERLHEAFIVGFGAELLEPLDHEEARGFVVDGGQETEELLDGALLLAELAELVGRAEDHPLGRRA